MLTKHYFNENGSYFGRASHGALQTPENGTVVTNYVTEYPFPVKLEEGVIVQDSTMKPYQGKWRTSKQIEEMKGENNAL